MIFDGRKRAEEIAQELKDRVAHMDIPPTLAIVLVGDNHASRAYIQKKVERAAGIGIAVQQIIFPADITEEKLISEINGINTDASITGIIVQLPLPKHIDAQTILNSVASEKDVDGLGEDSRVLTPVVGAVKDILETYDIQLADKKVVVVGKGRLVGLPAIVWLESEGVVPHVIDQNSTDSSEKLAHADIIISGAGNPHFIQPDMVKDGVVLLDAGTSEQGGELVGDIHPDCAQKASLYTPVPGGIGPMTVVLLLRNLVELASQ